MMTRRVNPITPRRGEKNRNKKERVMSAVGHNITELVERVY